MDLLDRLLGHDAWTTRQLLLICRALPDAQLDRAFDIGPRSVRRTLAHIVRNVEVWGDLMAGRAVHPGGDEGVRGPGGPAVPTVDALIARLDRATAAFAEVARAVARRGGWDERWTDTLDDPPTEKSFGGAIAHVVTHGMHHRAQALWMLRQLGVEGLPEGDVLSWEHRPR